MVYNQFQQIEGEFEYGELIISYKVTWVKDYLSLYQLASIDSIDEVTVWKGDEELEEYYNAHEKEVDNLIKEFAEEPDEWEQPTTADLLEAEAEYEYECANGY
jgi:hypothetical protein